MSSQRTELKTALFAGSDLRSFGGGERDLIGIANLVGDRDFTIFSYVDKDNVRYSYETILSMARDGINISYYKAHKIRYLRDIIPLSFSGLKALLSLRKYESTYSMHSGLLMNSLVLLFCKLFKVKFIFGIHSPIFFDDSPIEDSVLKRFLIKFYSRYRNYLVRHVGFVHVENKTDMKSVYSNGFKGTVYIITPRVLNDNLLPEVYNNKQEFITLFLGRLSVKHKGLDLLEQIIKLTMAKTDKIYFHIVGSGQEGENIVKNLLSDFPKNVKWMGFLSEDELKNEFKESSLFLFPSRSENFGISLAEAQSNGLPAVAFRVMGSEDVLTEKQQGTLITPFDVEAFSNSVVSFLDLWKNNPDQYYKLKSDIAQTIRERYSDQKLQEEYKKMFTGTEGAIN